MDASSDVRTNLPKIKGAGHELRASKRPHPSVFKSVVGLKKKPEDLSARDDIIFNSKK